MRPGDLCDETCTVDCGHCKGAGKVTIPLEQCGSFGCTLPKGHNMGRADIPENHRPAPLDLDAMKEWFESTRKSAGPWWPLMHKMPALLAEVERLRELADFARLLGPARMILDRCAVALEGMEEGQEAEQMAQRIVGLIGHPVTDEPPHALVELERLRAEKERWEREAERLERLRARSDVPDLCDEVERMREEVERLRESLRRVTEAWESEYPALETRRALAGASALLNRRSDDA